VMSRNQDGTAPAALLALEELTGCSFHDSISRGLSWITGANALSHDLRDLDRGWIWDSMGTRGRATHYWDAGRSFVNLPRVTQDRQLSIRYQVRPDHGGWLLYAFGRLGLPHTADSSKR